MADNKPQEPKNPGQGIRSMRSTSVFRLINFELYTKPVRTIVEYSHMHSNVYTQIFTICLFYVVE